MAGRSFLIRSPKEESDAAVKGSSVPVSDPVPSDSRSIPIRLQFLGPAKTNMWICCACARALALRAVQIWVPRVGGWLGAGSGALGIIVEPKMAFWFGLDPHSPLRGYRSIPLCLDGLESAGIWRWLRLLLLLHLHSHSHMTSLDLQFLVNQYIQCSLPWRHSFLMS